MESEGLKKLGAGILFYAGSFAFSLTFLFFFQNCADHSFFHSGFEVDSSLGNQQSENSTSLSKNGSCVLSANENGLMSLKKALSSDCKIISTLPNTDFRIQGHESIQIDPKITIVIPENSRWFLEEEILLQGGHFEISSLDKQVFFGSGIIRAASQAIDQESCSLNGQIARPEWFGAKVNDGLDDSLAISKAIDMGKQIILVEGRYDIQNRLWLKNGESLKGQGPLKTILKQSAQFNYVKIDDKELWAQLNHSDFIVGLDSDCSKVSDLQIDSTGSPNQVTYQSKAGVQIGFTLINGISISTHRMWLTNRLKQIQNTEVSRVKIVKPMSNCLAFFSYTGVKNSKVEQVECLARNNNSGQAGLTIESFHPNPAIANPYEGISISKSIFQGGYTGIYLAGAKSVQIEDTTVQGDLGTSVPLFIYTGDSGRSTNVSISNSYFSLMEPGDRSLAVVQLIGRNIRKDREGDHPFLKLPQDGGTSFSCYQCTLVSKANDGNEKLVPLILDSMGFTDTVILKKTQFLGGSYALLGQSNNDDFGASVVIENPNPKENSVVRDVTSYELYDYKLYHSDFQINQGHFVNQSLSSVRLNWGTLSVYDSTFQDIGTSLASQELPILDIGYNSPFHNKIKMSFFNNSFSAIHSNAFLRIPKDLDTPMAYGLNTIYFPSAQSKRILESLIYGGGKKY